jgi:hypothetical protein
MVELIHRNRFNCFSCAEFAKFAEIKKITIPSFHFPEKSRMPVSFKDMWLEKQENKDVALEKLARMMDDSNKPAYST